MGKQERFLGNSVTILPKYIIFLIDAYVQFIDILFIIYFLLDWHVGFFGTILITCWYLKLYEIP